MKSLFNNKSRTINIGGRLISFETPLVMGILNATPDSFHAPSRFNGDEAIVARVSEMLEQGASMIDIGAYSTRPGAAEVTEEEEIRRLASALNAIRKQFPDVIISVDTFRSNVARDVVHHFGVNIINDISGGLIDERMFDVVAKLNVPYVLMHMQGTLNSMHLETQYDDLLGEMMMFFSRQIEKLTYAGVCDIIIDPGFGFSKTMAHNFELLAHLHEFQMLELPILAGLSRKTMIWKTLGVTPEQALNGTSVLNTIALQKGANILRVHDVKEAVECVRLYQQLPKL